MNRDKAKEILQVHPPDAHPNDDPDVRRAFEKLSEDERLKAWYEEEKAFDRAVAQNLKRFPAPSALKEEILEGANLRPSVVSFPWIRPAYAAAAAIVLLTALAWGFLVMDREGASPQVAGETSRASPEFFGDLPSFFEREPDYDHFSTDLAELRRHVRDHGGPDPADVFPASLETVKGSRCRVFEQEQKRVSLICMEEQNSVIHFFVIEETRPASPAVTRTEPRFTEMGDWSFADWNESGKTCVLAIRGSKEKLKPYFQAPTAGQW